MARVLVYSPRYEFSLSGLERLHPFDAHKYSRAWGVLRGRLGPELEAAWWQEPRQPAAEAELRRVHSPAHLEALKRPAVVAEALELPALRFAPDELLERGVLEPMRLAVAGTNLAMACALEHSTVAMNIGGGFHHAFPDHGEGFCLYADVAIAIAAQRARGALGVTDAIGVIDLDAHRGNGFWACAAHDSAVSVLDVYNADNYPGPFEGDAAEYPFQVPVRAHVRDAEYLTLLEDVLPRFLSSLPRPRLVVYNAGTDIVAGDPIGGLSVTPAGVARRDHLVLTALAEHDIPAVIVTSGGYTERSYALIAELALRVVENARATGATAAFA